MSSRTIFLSRLIGLYCIVIALSMMTRRQATVETVTALLQNPSMMLIVGIITLAAGLAMVLAHNIWSGGALVVVVTLVGWITLIKSLFFLFLPPEMEAGLFLGQLHYRQLFYLYTGYFARPRRLPDLWRIQVKIKLASIQQGSQAGYLACSSKHLSRFTSHTRASAATSGCKRGIESQSIGGGGKGIRRPYQRRRRNWRGTAHWLRIRRAHSISRMLFGS